jgi:chaperonin GroES
MEINHQYFVVEIDKAAQTEKRQKIKLGEKPFLGLKAYTDVKHDRKGIHVMFADKDSPAEAAGFKSGDFITGVDNLTLESWEQFVEYIFTKQPGDEITIYLFNFLSITDRIQAKKVRLAGKVSELFRSVMFVDMQNNLQYGIIKQIGKLAGREFPQAQLGDALIFTHHVEYKSRPENDINFKDVHLIKTLPNGNELRTVDFSHECFGVIKYKDGQPTIIPFRNHIFCHQNIQKAKVLEDPNTGIYLPDSWQETMDDLESKLEELQLQIDEISKTTILSARTNEFNYDRKLEIFKQIDRIQKEKLEVSNKMRKSKLVELTVMYINPETQDTLGQPIKTGDKILANYFTLYPLDVGGVYFTLVPYNYADVLILNNNTMQPLYNSVIVLQDEAEETSESGKILIADTAKKKPGRGTIINAGPGTKEFPMICKSGDRVLFGEHAGQEFTHGGVTYRKMIATDIICVLQEGDAHYEKPPKLSEAVA